MKLISLFFAHVHQIEVWESEFRLKTFTCVSTFSNCSKAGTCKYCNMYMYMYMYTAVGICMCGCQVSQNIWGVQSQTIFSVLSLLCPYTLMFSVPLYTVHTELSSPPLPPITKISLLDRAATAVLARGAGKSLM